jgi:hypothetical protein
VAPHRVVRIYTRNSNSGQLQLSCVHVVPTGDQTVQVFADDGIAGTLDDRRQMAGGIIDVSRTVSPVRDETGRVVGASKIARDITEQKIAERDRGELLARERETRRTAELLNQVGPLLLAQLDLEKLAQEVTDLATALAGAEFGAFFRRVSSENGESCMLRARSGSAPVGFADFPPGLPAEGVLRNNDAKYPGVRSYLGGAGGGAVERSAGRPFLRTFRTRQVHRKP